METESHSAKKKERTRERLILAATRLYLDQGFEGTTVDEIAAAAGVSRRTFFRYFPTKESIVFPRQHQRLERFINLLAHYRDREPAFEAVGQACLDFARDYNHQRAELLAQNRILQSAPILQAREFEFDLEYEGAIENALLYGRKATAARTIRARIWAGALFGAIRAALRHWFAHDCRPDLVRLGREALRRLENGMTNDNIAGSSKTDRPTQARATKPKRTR